MENCVVELEKDQKALVDANIERLEQLFSVKASVKEKEGNSTLTVHLNSHTENEDPLQLQLAKVSSFHSKVAFL